MTVFKDAANRLKEKGASTKKLKEELRKKMDGLIEKLSAIVGEFEATRKELQEIPGTVYYEHAHPELFPEKTNKYR